MKTVGPKGEGLGRLNLIQQVDPITKSLKATRPTNCHFAAGARVLPGVVPAPFWGFDEASPRVQRQQAHEADCEVDGRDENNKEHSHASNSYGSLWKEWCSAVHEMQWKA